VCVNSATYQSHQLLLLLLSINVPFLLKVEVAEKYVCVCTGTVTYSGNICAPDVMINTKNWLKLWGWGSSTVAPALRCACNVDTLMTDTLMI